jgi:hypothetical protein
MPQSPALHHADDDQADADALDELEAQAEAQKADVAKLKATVQSISTPQKHEWWSVNEAMTISSVVLGFGLIALLVAAYLIRRESDSQVILRTLATILIVTFAIFLIVAGYSDQQIAPAMGLLGTIAGYLLGKESPARSMASATPKSDSSAP